VATGALRGRHHGRVIFVRHAQSRASGYGSRSPRATTGHASCGRTPSKSCPRPPTGRPPVPVREAGCLWRVRLPARDAGPAASAARAGGAPSSSGGWQASTGRCRSKRCPATPTVCAGARACATPRPPTAARACASTAPTTWSPSEDCRIASAALPSVGRCAREWVGVGVRRRHSDWGPSRPDGRRGGPAGDGGRRRRSWSLHASDFWQVHPGAAGSLALQSQAAGIRHRVSDAGTSMPESVVQRLARRRVGEAGSVIAVESRRCRRRACAGDLSDYPQVRCTAERVERFVRSRIAQGRLDIVVLDPPRRGAGARGGRAIARQHPGHRLRRLRPRGAGSRPGDDARLWIPAHVPAGLRHLPDDTACECVAIARRHGV
jgi:hypothetical protein